MAMKFSNNEHGGKKQEEKETTQKKKYPNKTFPLCCNFSSLCESSIHKPTKILTIKHC